MFQWMYAFILDSSEVYSMKKNYIFILFFFVLNSFLAAQLNRAQMWAITLTGIMTEVNNSSRSSLNASAMDARGRDTWLRVLIRDWEINNREELLETLDRMENGGHTASLREIQEIINELSYARSEAEAVAIMNKYRWDQTKYNRFLYVSSNWNSFHSRTIRAWDLGRNISLCRWGYNVGYLSEEEAWEIIFHYARIVQSMYNSWEEYGYDYFMGRLFWASSFGEEEDYFNRTQPIYDRLINSYWSWFDWFIDLYQGETENPPVRTIRFLEPEDNDGNIQFLTNDLALHGRTITHFTPNTSEDPNIYEIRVKRIMGNEGVGHGLIFCANDSEGDSNSYYIVYININGNFVVQKMAGGRLVNLGEFSMGFGRVSHNLFTGFNVYNTIRVERTDNEDGASFRLYLNSNLTAEFDDPDPLTGNGAGMVVYIHREREMFPHIPVDVRFYF